MRAQHSRTYRIESPLLVHRVYRSCVQRSHGAGWSHTPAVPPELSILASCSFPSVLSEAIEASVVEPNHARSADAIPLHSASPPRIGLGAYMGRLLKYCRCSPACLAYAYVYMKRLAAMGGMAVTSTSKHRLLLTGTVIAAKLVDDRCFSNNHCEYCYDDFRWDGDVCMGCAARE